MRQKLLVLLLILAMVITAIPLTASASTGTPVTSYQDIVAAIEAIPEGGSGEITIQDMYMSLAEGIYVEGKDITFNLIRSGLSTGVDQYGYGQPVIFAINSNIIINADEYSQMTTTGHTGMMGVVRVENISEWYPETETFEEEFSLTVNGGRYTSYKNDGSHTDENGDPIDDDTVFTVAPGTKAVITDVICNGTVEAIDYAGVDINVTGDLTINRGKFTNDVSQYAADGKYSYKAGDSYYVADKDPSYKFQEVAPGGKLVFNQVSPVEDPDSLWLLIDRFNMDNEEADIHLNSESFNSDYSQCILLTGWDTSKEAAYVVDVVWNYDEETVELAKTYVDKIPSDIEYFKVQDMELINYWVNLSKNSETYAYLSDYSGELKGYLDYTNFSLVLDEARAGSDDPFVTEQLNPASLQYEDVTYHVYERIGARANHVLYVSDDTADSKDALIAAAQKRVDDYAGKGIVQITDSNQTVKEYYDSAIAKYDADIAEAEQGLALAQEAKAAEEAKDPALQDLNLLSELQFKIWDYEYTLESVPMYKAGFMEGFAEDGYYNFLNDAAADMIVNIKVGDNTYLGILIKDSSKMITPSCKTADLNSKIEISTEDTSVPLDTMVSVDKLTSGDEYDRISKALNMKEGDMYDLTLFSKSLGKNVTKLENGMFLVKLPVPDGLKGQDLVVYYVDDKDNVTPYPVKSEGDFVSFETDHFSIYTLATTGLAPDKDAGNGTGSATTGNTTDTTPKTGDATHMLLWLGLLAISGTVVAGLSIKKKRAN